MTLRFTMDFPESFSNLYNEIYSNKKGKMMLEIEGIDRDNLDIVKKSKQYFLSNNVADVSIDANANVDSGINHANYINELIKPMLKLENYYLIYRMIEKEYGEDVASSIFKSIIYSDIYLHDPTSVQIPYSYHQDTSIIVKINGEIKLLTMKRLMELYKDNIKKLPDREQVEFDDLNIISKHKRKIGSCNEKELVEKKFGKKKIDIKIFVENTWKDLNVVLKHKRHGKMYCIETEDGRLTVVTDDHPVILQNGKTKLASKITTEDYLKFFDPKLKLTEKYKIDYDFAYLLGFILGDGWSRERVIEISQNLGEIYDKIIDILEKKDINYNIYDGSSDKNKKIRINEAQFVKFVNENFYIGKKCFDKQLPDNILEWEKESIIAFISGIIDSDGSVEKNSFNIRLSNLGCIQQLYMILNNFDKNYISCRKMTTQPENYKNSFAPSISFGYCMRFSPKCEITKLFTKHSIKMENFDNSDYNKNYNTTKNTSKVRKIIEIDSNHETLEYVYDITVDGAEFYSNGLIQHNCFSMTTTRIMYEGRFWSEPIALPPKSARSFIGQVLETVMNMASTDFAGAIAISDLFVNYSYYAKKENLTDKQIENDFQSFVHKINNKFSRGSQACFTNISVFCENNLRELFADYMFPDLTAPDIDYIMKVQEIYMNFFCKGDPKTSKPYRFPVLTASFLHDDKENLKLDEKFLDIVAEHNIKKGIMNIYSSNSVGKVSSCCRLSNDLKLLGVDSFGNGGLNIGSARVVSLNLPRFALESEFQTDDNESKIDRFFEILDENLENAHKTLIAHRKLLHKRVERGFLQFVSPIKYVDIDKMLFSTIGILGMYEMMYYLCDGNLFDDNNKLKENVIKLEKEIITHINETVMLWSKNENVRYNLEEVPGESLAPKFALKDKIMYGEEDQIFRIYSNQFVPLHINMDIFDRMKYEGMFFDVLSGGGISHLNMKSELKSKEDMKKIIRYAIECNLQHFAINYNFNECENGHLIVGDNNDKICVECGGEIIDSISRVVGFFVPKSQMNKERRDYEFLERKFKSIDK